MDIAKWACVLIVVLILKTVNMVVWPPQWDPDKAQEQLADLLAFNEPIPYRWHLRALQGYLAIFVITALFDRGYDNVIVRVNWLFRDLCWIPWSDVVLSATVLAVLWVAVLAMNSTANVYMVTLAIVGEQLWLSAAAICLTLAHIQGVYLAVAVFYGVAWNPPDWVSSPVLYVWRFAAAASIATVPFTAVIVAKIGRPAVGTVWRSAAVVCHVLAPVVRPWRYPPADNYEPSAEFVAPDASSAPQAGCELLLVSDTHLTAPGSPVIDSDRPSEATVGFVQRVSAETEYAAVIHAGDITDRGATTAWRHARSLFGRTSALRVAVPGNHDVHFHRVMTGIPLTAGTKPAWVVEDEVAKFQGWPDEVTTPVGLFRDQRTGKPIPGLFPTVTRVPDHPVLIVGLNSNLRASSTPLTNALGLVGSDQLDTARQRVRERRRPDDLLLVVVHHHLLLPAFSIQHGYLRCLDAELVLRFAADERAAAVVHGHKHMPYVCRYQDPANEHTFLVVSCGSAHHDAGGRFAVDVGGPSCYRMSIRDGRIVGVRLIRDSVPEGAASV